MKYDVLFNFISPVTGRLCIPEDYILIGDGQGFSTPSPILIDMRLDITNLRRDVNDIFDTSFIIAFPDIDFPNAQVLSALDNGFMYNTEGIISTTPTIPITGLTDLTNKHLWSGDENNRPVEKLALIIDNLPNLGVATNPIYLGKGKIWRGTPSDRPIESDDLSALEITVDFIQNVTIPAIQADIATIQGQIIAIQTELALIQAHLTAIDTAIAIIQGQLLVIQGQIIAINQRIDNLRLNNIPADGDVSFYNYKLINLADPVNPTDGVNLRTLISYINNVPTTIELIGDVTGSGNTGTPITTTLQLTLDEIKIAQDKVNLNNQKIINLKSDNVEQQDALNAKFLWDLMHDQVGVVWV